MNVSELLEFSVKHNASDLHLSANVAPMLRIDGDMRKLDMEPFSNSQVHALIADIMTDAQKSEYEEKLEIDFSFELPNVGRFRVNAFNQARGCAAVFRTIPTVIPSFDDIAAPEIFETFCNYEKGLVLVTGATGSGKSTTLASMIDYINRNHKKHILTIEDPIEFTHQNKNSLINQREVFRDTHSFAAALKSALREDPDVILVGELRDQETIRLALTAAETGHLVFGTLHTSSAAKTVDRIIDVFPGTEKNMVRSMLSESLNAVISQKLIKRIGGGRVACHEILIANSAIRNLIREDKIAQMQSVLQTGSSTGMQTMEQAMRTLVQQGEIEDQVFSNSDI